MDKPLEFFQLSLSLAIMFEMKGDHIHICLREYRFKCLPIISSIFILKMILVWVVIYMITPACDDYIMKHVINLT